MIKKVSRVRNLELINLFLKHISFMLCEEISEINVLKRYFLYGWVLYPLTQYFSGDKVEKNEVGGACSTYEGEKRGASGFGGKT
jgi:hypothetical protein